MEFLVIALALISSSTYLASAGEIRLLDLEPTDAQQYIDKQDTSLKYAPKIEEHVPAVRFLGRDQHHVLEDIYLANQYHGQDGLGGYLYGYAVPDIAKTERKKAGGDLRGAYNYVTGDGQEIKVEYWDDGTGFHQIDNVPKILPKQIDDLPEVKAAKEEHLRLWQEQAERNSKPVQSPYNSAGQYASGPLAPQNQQQLQYSQQAPQQFQVQHQERQSVKYHQQFQQPIQYQQQQEIYHSQPSYQGQSSETVNQYQVRPQEDNGEYVEEKRQPKQAGEEEEPQGPPKGFFYSFDYPVGIIVQKEGLIKKRENLKSVYESNKANFEKQLRQGQGDARSTRSSSGYLYA